MRARAAAAVIASLVASPCASFAQGEVVSSTFPFPAWHAAPAAEGGAGSARPGMEYAVLNPAALAGARGGQFSRHDSPAGSDDNLITLAHTGRWGTLGVTFQRRDWGEVARDLGLDDLSAGEQDISVGYARVLGQFRAGVSVARLDTDYLGVRAGGWGVDVGMQADAGRGLRVGAAMIHAGRLENDEGDPVRLPARVRSGGSWTLTRSALAVTTSGDVAVPLEGKRDPDLHAGVQAGYGRGSLGAVLRTGWRSLGNPYGAGEAEKNWTFGGGVSFGKLRADLARAVGGSLDDETFLSLSVGW